MRDIFDDEVDKKDSKDFAALFEQSLGGVSKKLQPGDKIHGEILSINKDEVFVSTGTINDGMVVKKDLVDADGNFKYKVGDFVDLYVTQVKGADIRLSTKPTAKNIAEDLEDAFDMMLPVEGRVSEACNGGFRIDVLGKTAFCPISQIDLKRVDKPEDYVGHKFQFMITKFEGGGRNIVVSRKKLLEEERQASEAAFTDEVKPGQVVKGVVTRIEKFGAFVELSPGLEGLAHISELGWSRITDPTEVVQVGQQVSVKVLSIQDVDGKLKISLSLKQAGEEPWQKMPDSIKVGSVVRGKVTRCLKFGAFVELAPGIEGLVPVQEMSLTKRVMHAEEIVKPGETVTVMIKDIKLDDRRISLSMKDTEAQPEQEAWSNYTKTQSSQGLGTLGDQFKKMFEKK